MEMILLEGVCFQIHVGCNKPHSQEHLEQQS